MEMIAQATQTAQAAQAARHEAARAPAAAAASAASSEGRTPQGGKFLTCRLGAEEYGIDILRVQEIRSYEQPARVASTPAFIKGVLNLRGVIVPIIDLRLKLGCDSAECNSFTAVVVLNLRGRVVGAVVDAVSDVLELGKDPIQPAPELACGVASRFITGIGTRRNGDSERRLLLIDIEGLMSCADVGLVGA